ETLEGCSETSLRALPRLACGERAGVRGILRHRMLLVRSGTNPYVAADEPARTPQIPAGRAAAQSAAGRGGAAIGRRHRAAAVAHGHVVGESRRRPRTGVRDLAAQRRGIGDQLAGRLAGAIVLAVP